MQVTIARQLGLDPSTVSNFFMNARRRSVDKWKDDRDDTSGLFDDDMRESDSPPLELTSPGPGGRSAQSQAGQHSYHEQVSLKPNSQTQAVLVAAANPAAVVQHLQPQDAMTPTAALDLWPPSGENGNYSALNKRGLSTDKVTCKSP